MNSVTYGIYYSKYHKCSISFGAQNIFVFDFEHSPYDPFMIKRMVPAENVSIDSNKPLLLALKSFFKADVPASVVCSQNYLWTITLGNERMIYPGNKDVKKDSLVQFYASPYFVQSPDYVKRYLYGTIRPAYENVFYYKNTIMYLDNQDLPFPGGCYFNKCDPVDYYRLCFLSDEPVDKVINLITEWQGRRDIQTVHYMTRDAKADLKFINFIPVNESGFNEANILSTGNVNRKMSSKKPELLIQDILNAYYRNLIRRPSKTQIDNISLGLFIEYPFMVTYEGARTSNLGKGSRKFVALSVNGTNPSRVLHVYKPYNRYIEYSHVPTTIWTPISFVWSTLVTDSRIQKVAIDTVVIGLVYRETFFCFSQPLLEGNPTKSPAVNEKYILSTANMDLNQDVNVRVFETFKYSDNYSLKRVALAGLETWCLTKSTNTDPYPKNIKLPELVKQWLDFFTYVGEDTFEVDVSAVRVALMMSKHKLCFNLKLDKNGRDGNNVILDTNEVDFYFDEKVVQFINDARLIKVDDESVVGSKICSIS